ncbi:MAG: helix-turn-helix domain-containing protein [Candidatus Acidiferrales bacterium]
MKKGKPKSQQRSGCPVSISLEALGDRWSLLIIRDMMVRAFHTFKQFQESDEKIATNILADRLQKLMAAGIITAEPEKSDGRKVNYRLTEKGIDLAPVVLDLLIWGTRHEETGAPNAVVEKMAANREEVLVEVRRRWRERDPVPFLPSFAAYAEGRKSKQPGPERTHLRERNSRGESFVTISVQAVDSKKTSEKGDENHGNETDT